MRGKGAAFFRNEFREQVGLAGRDQFLTLLFRDFALQNYFADAERARFLRGDGMFAGVGIIERVDLALVANGTLAQRFVPRGINRDAAAAVILFKLKLRFEFFAQFHRGGEGPAHLAPESFKRSDPALREKRFNFSRLEKTAGHRFPNDQSATTAFEGAIVFIKRTAAALRTFHFDRREVSTDAVAFEVLRFLDDLAREILDLRHELLALHLAFLDLLELVLPLARHLRRTESRDADPAQERDERQAFRGRDQLASLAAHVF